MCVTAVMSRCRRSWKTESLSVEKAGQQCRLFYVCCQAAAKLQLNFRIFDFAIYERVVTIGSNLCIWRIWESSFHDAFFQPFGVRLVRKRANDLLPKTKRKRSDHIIWRGRLFVLSLVLADNLLNILLGLATQLVGRWSRFHAWLGGWCTEHPWVAVLLAEVLRQSSVKRVAQSNLKVSHDWQ